MCIYTYTRFGKCGHVSSRRLQPVQCAKACRCNEDCPVKESEMVAEETVQEDWCACCDTEYEPLEGVIMKRGRDLYDEVERVQTYFQWKGVRVFTAEDHGEIAAVCQAAKDDFAKEAKRSPVNASYAELDLGLEYAMKRCKILLDCRLQAAPGKEFQPELLFGESKKKWEEVAGVEREMERLTDEQRSYCRTARMKWQTQQLCDGVKVKAWPQYFHA